MDMGNSEMVTAICILAVISFCLLGMCYSLHITFCHGTCGSDFCCNIRQNSTLDDSIATPDVLYNPVHSRRSTDDTSIENNSIDDDDDDTDSEGKKKSSRIVFLSKEENN